MPISTILTESIVESIFSAIKEKIEELRKNSCWEELFVNTGEFFINNEEHSTDFYEDLNHMFSKDNMKLMASKLKGSSGYTLYKALQNDLYVLMKSYEFDIENIKTYTHSFMQVIISYLENNKPDHYLQIIIGIWKEEERNNFNKIQERIKSMEYAIQVLGEKKKNIYSISEIDTKIRKETTVPQIGIEFFNIDDEEFLCEFYNKIDLNRLYVVGKSREETIFCILNEIDKMNINRIVLVVKNENDWNQLDKDNIKDAILVPWFYVNSIVAIEGNTNIFVYGEDEPCYARDIIKLKKRTRKTIVENLQKAGLNVQDAYDLAESTHGLYVPMKMKIFNGARYDKPNWFKSENGAFICALLCGKWTESDKHILEELSNMSYDDIMHDLSPYMKGENPFIVEVNGHGGLSYQLACVEMAWEFLGSSISKKNWEKFIEIFYKIFIDTEYIDKVESEELINNNNYANNHYCSSTINHGMIRSFIMRSYYENDKDHQYEINYIIQKVMDSITSTIRWGFIAEYFTDFCEAAPEVILNRLENELKETTGMKELFIENYTYGNFGENSYTNILWAAEQLLLQKDYAVRAVQWLWGVDDLNIHYNISNSPKSTLENVFCAWLNVCVLSVEEKISCAKWAIEKYENAWEIIHSEFPTQRSEICSSLNYPKYRNIDDIKEMTIADLNKTYVEYMDACLNKMDFSVKRWKNIIEAMNNYDVEIIDKITEKLFTELQLMNDEEKITIKGVLRNEIYRHRFFSNSEWSMPEAKISKFVNTMNQISTFNPVYEYLYLYESVYDFPLINPNPFNSKSSDNEYRKKNELLREEEIEKGTKDFEEKKLSIKELLVLCCKKDKTTVGKYIAKYYGDRIFNPDFINMMLECKIKEFIIFDYVMYFYYDNRNILDDAIDIVVHKEECENLLISLLSLEQIADSKQINIAKQSEVIKNKFWKKSGIYNIKLNKESYQWALSECRKYGSQNSFLELLFEAKNYLITDDLFKEFMSLNQIYKDSIFSINQYYLKEIIHTIQNEYMFDDEKCRDICTVELGNSNILDWSEMKCTQLLIKEDPTIYAEIIKIVFFKVDEDKESRTEEMRGRSMSIYDIYDKAHFCPAEKEGKVELERLKNWVSKFKNLLEQQEQGYMFNRLIGRLFAFSPVGDDNCNPCESVRNIIEEIYSDTLKSSYIIAENNKRGVYVSDAGKTELEMSKHYKENANKIRVNYPRTATIYDSLSKAYNHESMAERRRAEDDW